MVRELFMLLAGHSLITHLHIGSLRKDADKRPSYAELLEHPFITKYENVDVDMAKWANDAYEARQQALANHNK